MLEKDDIQIDGRGVPLIPTDKINYKKLDPDYKYEFVPADLLYLTQNVLGCPLPEGYEIHIREGHTHTPENLFLLTTKQNKDLPHALSFLARRDEKYQDAIKAELYDFIQKLSDANIETIKGEYELSFPFHMINNIELYIKDITEQQEQDNEHNRELAAQWMTPLDAEIFELARALGREPTDEEKYECIVRYERENEVIEI